MPVIMQIGKQRVPQGLPILVSLLVLGSRNSKSTELKGYPLHFRLLVGTDQLQPEVRFTSGYFNAEVGGWGVIETDYIPPGVYEVRLGGEFDSSSVNTLAILDKESYEKLLEEENDEEFDEGWLTTPDELFAFVKQVAANHPATQSTILLGGYTLQTFYGARYGYSNERIGFTGDIDFPGYIGFKAFSVRMARRPVSEARLRYGLEAFFSDFLYFSVPVSLAYPEEPFRSDSTFNITEEGSIDLQAKVRQPYLPAAVILERFRPYADIVQIARFHPKVYRSEVDNMGGQTIFLKLVISSSRAELISKPA